MHQLVLAEARSIEVTLTAPLSLLTPQPHPVLPPYPVNLAATKTWGKEAEMWALHLDVGYLQTLNKLMRDSVQVPKHHPAPGRPPAQHCLGATVPHTMPEPARGMTTLPVLPSLPLLLHCNEPFAISFLSAATSKPDCQNSFAALRGAGAQTPKALRSTLRLRARGQRSPPPAEPQRHQAAELQRHPAAGATAPLSGHHCSAPARIARQVSGCGPVFSSWENGTIGICREQTGTATRGSRVFLFLFL